MKTVNDGAIEFLKSGEGRSIDGGYIPVEWFNAGYDFAQRWICVDDELPKKLVQVIVKLENGWHTCTWITENGDFAFNVKPTHWRYIDIE